MSIGIHKDSGLPPTVVSAETMLRAIEALGIVPFFENPIPGYSIEEMTPKENWFDGQDNLCLTPWDWKIFIVQSGEVAYGKFLWGGKAAFATVEWYSELMNWRRSLPAARPTDDQQKVLSFLQEHGSIGIKDIRALLGVKKSAADALMTRLQMQCRVVTGDITRVYRGPDLHYNGWQVSSFCTPESLFCADAIPGPGGFPFEGALPPAIPRGSRPVSPSDAVSAGPSDDGHSVPFMQGYRIGTEHSPAESLERLVEHILRTVPGATESLVRRMLRY